MVKASNSLKNKRKLGRFWPPRPNKDRPTPCPYFLMPCTEQGPRPSAAPFRAVNQVRMYGHAVGMHVLVWPCRPHIPSFPLLTELGPFSHNHVK